MSDAVRLHVAPGASAAAATVRIGVPLPRAWVEDPAVLVATAGAHVDPIALQPRVLSRWSDRSVRWLLCDLALPAALVAAGGEIRIVRGEGPATNRRSGGAVVVDRRDGGFVVSTPQLSWRFEATQPVLLSQAIDTSGAPLLSHDGVRLRLVDRNGRERAARIDRIDIESSGPVVAVVAVVGGFEGDCPLTFVARWTFGATEPGARLCVRIRNPRSALHAGGLWDLGDPGSYEIGDLSVELTPAWPCTEIERRYELADSAVRLPAGDWSIYQDSSGGEQWASPNHVEADGRLGVRFRGWSGRDPDGAVRTGDRAQPALAAIGVDRQLAVTVRDFWQNFPKALRWQGGRLSVGLFPAERGRALELQGGEQKRHEIALAFGVDALARAERLLEPPHAWVDPSWVETTAALPGFVADLSGSPSWERHVRSIVDGPDSFVERRERIDEYGWRNFGDLWADHEAIRHRGPEPFVSHYNNQYDFVFAAGLHAMRTGDARWARLARECAEHTVDIDIYHTQGDRAAFNGGLFWHTDHHVPAGTSTHRTYSRSNAHGSDYGGGPSNEHAYASGLLLHWWRTGDPDAREAVAGLGDWILAMDDGSRTLFGLIDAGPTGLASRTVSSDYHGPGRGAGNAIATLLDAWLATGAHRYLAYAEGLIQRCVHPADDVPGRGLEDVEHRWSYLMFLQALGRYLETKLELGELDWSFHYARESLLRYATWMLEHEVPYLEVLDRVEFPTESWSAHDIRKCDVLHRAARFDDGARVAAFRERAAFFHDRCIADLETFPTQHFVRPLVLLAGMGHLHAYHLASAPLPPEVRSRWRHALDFGTPAEFRCQRDRLRSTLRDRLGEARRDLARIFRTKVERVLHGRADPAGRSGR